MLVLKFAGFAIACLFANVSRLALPISMHETNKSDHCINPLPKNSRGFSAVTCKHNLSHLLRHMGTPLKKGDIKNVNTMSKIDMDPGGKRDSINFGLCGTCDTRCKHDASCACACNNCAYSEMPAIPTIGGAVIIILAILRLIKSRFHVKNELGKHMTSAMLDTSPTGRLWGQAECPDTKKIHERGLIDVQITKHPSFNRRLGTLGRWVGSLLLLATAVTPCSGSGITSQKTADPVPSDTPQWATQGLKHLSCGFGEVLLFGECYSTETTTELVLSRNSLSTLPSQVGQLTALYVMNLAGNSLSTLPSQLGQLTALHRMILRTNSLSTLPSQLGRLTALQELSLEENFLSTLPSQLGQLTALSFLRLNDNILSSLPSQLGLITELFDLDLSKNSLSTLPSQLGQLTGLFLLALSQNVLPTVPSQLGRLSNLVRLGLDHNILSTFPPQLMQLPRLDTLDLSKNSLSTLPSQLSQLTTLRLLFLQHNKLVLDVDTQPGQWIFDNSDETFVEAFDNMLYSSRTLSDPGVVLLALMSNNCLFSSTTPLAYQRSEEECMVMGMTGLPAANTFTNRTTYHDVTMYEVLPDFVTTSLGLDSQFVGATLTVTLGGSENLVYSHSCTTSTSGCLSAPLPGLELTQDGVYTAEVVQSANVGDKARCQSALEYGNCPTTLADECRGISCTFDDIYSVPSRLSWTVDTVPPIAQLRSGSRSSGDFLDRNAVTVEILASEAGTTLSAGLVETEGCSNRTDSHITNVDGGITEISCEVAQGTRVTWTIPARSFTDLAGNTNAGRVEFSLTRLCPLGHYGNGTACIPCEDGSYAETGDLSDQCEMCDDCLSQDEIIHHECTPTANAVCGCANGFRTAPDGSCDACAPLHRSVEANGMCSVIDRQSKTLVCVPVLCPPHSTHRDTATNVCRCDEGHRDGDGSPLYNPTTDSFTPSICVDRTPPSVLNISCSGLTHGITTNLAVLECVMDFSEPIEPINLDILSVVENCVGGQAVMVSAQRVGVICRPSSGAFQLGVSAFEIMDLSGNLNDVAKLYQLVLDRDHPSITQASVSAFSRGTDELTLMLPSDSNSGDPLHIAFKPSEPLQQAPVLRLNGKAVASVSWVEGGDGVWSGEVSVRGDTPPGTLQISVTLVDVAGNENSGASLPLPQVIKVECPVGHSNSGLSYCARIPCPEGTVGHPVCRCELGYEGEIRFTGSSYTGECTACQQGFVNDGTLDVCRASTTVQVSCQECLVCQFPRFAKSKCRPQRDAECSSTLEGFLPLLIALALALATFGSLRDAKRKTNGTDQSNAFRFKNVAHIIALAFIGYADLATDLYFAIYEASESPTFFILSIAFLVLPLVGSTMMHLRIVRYEAPRDENLGHDYRDYIKNKYKSFSTLVILSSVNPRLLLFVFEGCYGLSGRERKTPFYRHLVYFSAVSILFQDLPQLCLQFVFAITRGFSYVTVMSLLFSVASVAALTISRLLFYDTTKSKVNVKSRPGQLKSGTASRSTVGTPTCTKFAGFTNRSQNSQDGPSREHKVRRQRNSDEQSSEILRLTELIELLTVKNLELREEIRGLRAEECS